MLLVTLLGLAIWAYWQERRRNERVAEQRLTEAREDTEAMVSALTEATNAVEQFKASNDALKTTIELLIRFQQQRRGADP